MDELNSSFGRLSTAAAEWKPGGGGQSDLQAAAVKEFVPGQGWSSVATPPASPTRSGESYRLESESGRLFSRWCQ